MMFQSQKKKTQSTAMAQLDLEVLKIHLFCYKHEYLSMAQLDLVVKLKIALFCYKHE